MENELQISKSRARQAKVIEYGMNLFERSLDGLSDSLKSSLKAFNPHDTADRLLEGINGHHHGHGHHRLNGRA